jgi:hypothetical protein
MECLLIPFVALITIVPAAVIISLAIDGMVLQPVFFIEQESHNA